jgi:hypothetical protein
MGGDEAKEVLMYGYYYVVVLVPQRALNLEE